ncbi:hypothetical protein [Vibrio phage phiKT1024]|nr:hypothetical protein [Vibrio phage phiKT1024]
MKEETKEEIILTCSVNGVLGRRGKLVGMCPHIGCGSNRCFSEEQCQHQKTLNEVREKNNE